MRFLVDMGVSPRVARWLCERGHDAVHLRDQGLQKLGDDVIFAKACAENRVVVTWDLDFAEIVSASRSPTSTIVLRLRDTRTERVLSRLEAVLERVVEALESGAIVSLEDTRHRVRRLPVGRVSE